MNWRLLIDRSVDHNKGLAVDDALVRLSTESKPVTLRLYTYNPCALIGRFQHLDDEINLDACYKSSVPFNRRPSGGGAIIMGPDQLGLALVIPHTHSIAASRSHEIIATGASGLVNALAGLGIKAELHGKNDLVVDGRKIAGLGLYRGESGDILFHASLLLDIDIRYMLTILKTDPPKRSDRDCETADSRICTVRSELGQQMSMNELVGAVISGYQNEFSVNLEQSEIHFEELALASELDDKQYSTAKWVHQSHSQIRDQIGQFKLRTLGGTIDVQAIVAGEIVKSVMFGGDFIATDSAVYDLESSLRWHVRDLSSIRGTVMDSFERHAGQWNKLEAQEVADAVTSAVKQCADASPYRVHGSCFVNTESEVV